ncbi:MAG: TIGR02452 family protein [Alphaproteobacteria bacterium]|jgi:uncharacterized protein (TIGR02452 family)|nr:TIGR02452 family protein [Alphaproteobacteria bacterium]
MKLRFLAMTLTATILFGNNSYGIDLNNLDGNLPANRTPNNLERASSGKKVPAVMQKSPPSSAPSTNPKATYDSARNNSGYASHDNNNRWKLKGPPPDSSDSDEDNITPVKSSAVTRSTTRVRPPPPESSDSDDDSPKNSNHPTNGVRPNFKMFLREKGEESLLNTGNRLVPTQKRAIKELFSRYPIINQANASNLFSKIFDLREKGIILRVQANAIRDYCSGLLKENESNNFNNLNLQEDASYSDIESPRMTRSVSKGIRTSVKVTDDRFRLRNSYESVEDYNKFIRECNQSIFKNSLTRTALRIDDSISYSQRITLQEAISMGGKVSRSPSKPAVVKVVAEDTITSVINMKDACKKVVVLNCGDRFRPGGGYWNGRTAQEEACCRPSTLPAILFARKSWYNAPPQDQNLSREQLAFYGLPHTNGIHSPNVHIFRNPKTYVPLESSVVVDFVTLAAPNLNEAFKGRFGEECELPRGVTKEKYQQTEEYQNQMRDKIRPLFQLAINSGCDGVCAAALGCGVFENDPNIVSQLYLDVLGEAPEHLNGKRYVDMFKEVRFSITPGKNHDIFSNTLNNNNF